MKLLLTVAAGIASLSVSAAQQPRFGEIQNSGGFGCTFSQRQERAEYLNSLPSNETILTFHDPRCMSDEGDAGFLNRTSIASAIAYSYSHRNANFAVLPNEWHDPISPQLRGKCVQSRRYPSVGVAVDFQTLDGYISEVRHSITLSGCAN